MSRPFEFRPVDRTSLINEQAGYRDDDNNYDIANGRNSAPEHKFDRSSYRDFYLENSAPVTSVSMFNKDQGAPVSNETRTGYDLTLDDQDDPITVPLRNVHTEVTSKQSAAFQEIIKKYEINPNMASRFDVLEQFEVVVLCDDSGSMRTPSNISTKTRWDELQEIVTLAVEVCSTIISSGIDVYFLNREPLLKVTNSKSIKKAFEMLPSGSTPLCPALRKIFESTRTQPSNKKSVILIATDGAPTNENGDEDVRTLESILHHERPLETYITFLVCTDDCIAVDYLLDLDNRFDRLDVVEDFNSERKLVKEKHGATFPFSYGDYIAKALLGSIDTWLDKLNE